MKNVTFFIGNGFDLNLKLKTRYIDFYNEYIKIKQNDNRVIQFFKNEILKNEAHGWKDWKDFELGMGQQSILFVNETQVEDFIECFNDFCITFNDYLKNECIKIDWDVVDNRIYGGRLKTHMPP